MSYQCDIYIYLAGIFYTDKNLQEKQSGKVERGCDHLRSVLNDLFEPRQKNCTKFTKSIAMIGVLQEISMGLSELFFSTIAVSRNKPDSNRESVRGCVFYQSGISRDCKIVYTDKNLQEKFDVIMGAFFFDDSSQSK